MSKLKHSVKAERDVLRPVMRDYYAFFLYDRSGLLPCTGKGFHEIKTGNAVPVKKNQYKVPFALRDEMKRHETIQRGVITPSCSEWATPVILVNKNLWMVRQNTRFVQTFEV
jgi:hypothetical protein